MADVLADEVSDDDDDDEPSQARCDDYWYDFSAGKVAYHILFTHKSCKNS